MEASKSSVRNKASPSDIKGKNSLFGCVNAIRTDCFQSLFQTLLEGALQIFIPKLTLNRAACHSQQMAMEMTSLGLDIRQGNMGFVYR